MRQSLGDIVLLEGSNELNIQMVPLAPAQFEYVSNIRQESWPGTRGYGGIKFEVDIKNIGGTAGICHPVAWIEASAGAGNYYVDMGEQLIAPGQTATFYGEWSLTWRLGPYDWWEARNIISEAGVITFAFGRSLKLISVDIEPAGGGEYWVTQTIRVPSNNACFIPTITIAGIVASQAQMYPPRFDYPQIRITRSGEYKIRGVYEAYIGDPYYGNFPVALPKGTYNIVSKLRYGYVVGASSVMGWYTAWGDIVVGQVEIT